LFSHHHQRLRHTPHVLQRIAEIGFLLQVESLLSTFKYGLGVNDLVSLSSSIPNPKQKLSSD
jgi:hypothetical protein